MVGGLGISGDGIDQDDFATVGGAAGFMAPEGIRADRIIDLVSDFTIRSFRAISGLIGSTPSAITHPIAVLTVTIALEAKLPLPRSIKHPCTNESTCFWPKRAPDAGRHSS
jgi:hypothetical protein